MGTLLYKIHQAYLNFEKTKDEKYKKEWNDLIKQLHNYINNETK